MRTTGIFLGGAALLAALLAHAPVRADEPHLELIRGLRAGGEPQLALEYIERLGPKLPPALAQVMGLELARTRVDIAREENEEGKRLALFAAARAEFEAFLKANPNHSLAPQARFEIARLIASQGKDAVNRARRAEGEARAKALRDARAPFEDAAKQLANAAKQLKTQLDSLGDPKTPEEKSTARDTQQSWLQAQLEEGMNLYHLGQTYATEERSTTDDLKKRAQLIIDAGKAFDRLSAVDPKNPLCWLGRAWLARCWYENDDYPKATAEFEVVTQEKGPHADEAKRVATYFRILMARKQGTLTLPQQLTQMQGWVERYRPYLSSPEGCGIRYALADVLEKQAYAIAGGIKLNDKGRPISVTSDAAAKLKDAEKHLRALTEFENDFTDRAANKRMRIILAVAIRETPDRDPAKLTTFENCFLLALLEVAELNEELKDPGNAENEKQAELRKKHFQRAVKALDRGLTLVKSTDPPKEVLDARIMEVYANFVAGNNYPAAVMGEYLAKTMARQSRGAVPALYSLQAYRNVMMETKVRGDAKEPELRTDHEQVLRMATFMEATWPNDSPTDTARHTLGTLYFTDGDFVKALETYSRVTPSYVSLAFLRNEQGIACFNLQKDPKAPAAVKRQWFDRITTELEKMPDLGTGAEPEPAYAYCLARLQLATLLLQEGKQFARVELIGKAVMDLSTKLSLGEKSGEVKSLAQSLALAGLYGRVYDLMKVHKYADAAALYGPGLADLEKNPPAEEDTRVRKPATELMQLALRSSVQEGNIDRAQAILKQLEKMGGATGGQGALVQVLREIQNQIADMRKNEPTRLKDTLDKFTSFMETLAGQKNLSKEVKIFLAQGFDTLDKPTRAIELLDQITVPTEKDPGKPPAPPPENAPEAERTKYEEAKNKYDAAKSAFDTAWRTHWFAELAHVRALRHAGRLETDAAKKAKLFDTADKMIDKMIGTPQKQGWAFNSLEVRREKIFIVEDQEKWAAAMQQWQAMQRPFVGKFTNPPKDEKEGRMRAAYFEIRFYMIRLVYKSKQKLKDQKKKEADVRKLADQIVDLEKDPRTSDFGGGTVKKLYQDWLADEPLMRKHYEAAKGKALLSGVETAGGQ